MACGLYPFRRHLAIRKRRVIVAVFYRAEPLLCRSVIAKTCNFPPLSEICVIVERERAGRRATGEMYDELYCWDLHLSPRK